MKRLILQLSGTALLWFLTFSASAQTAPMNDVNQRVQAIMAQNIHKIDSALRDDALASSQAFTELKTLCRASWSPIIDNFNSIEGGSSGKTMVLNACEALDPPDYMSALEKLVTRFKAGQLERTFIETVLAPTGRMRAFLADNYQHSRVQALLNDLKPRFADKPDVVTDINEILTGTAKTDIDDFREAHQGTSTGDIPRVLLQP